MSPTRPDMIWWRMESGVLLTSVLGPPAFVDLALSRDHQGGSANHAVLRQRIPYGAMDWSADPKGPWRPVKELPPQWGLKH